MSTRSHGPYGYLPAVIVNNRNVRDPQRVVCSELMPDLGVASPGHPRVERSFRGGFQARLLDGISHRKRYRARPNLLLEPAPQVEVRDPALCIFPFPLTPARAAQH